MTKNSKLTKPNVMFHNSKTRTSYSKASVDGALVLIYYNDVPNMSDDILNLIY